MDNSSTWIIFTIAVFATYFWRFMGVFVSHLIKPNHPAFELFTCLAYGIVAALVAKTLILPSGVLAEVPLWQRIVPMALAFFVYHFLGKRLWLGIIIGETALITILLYDESAF